MRHKGAHILGGKIAQGRKRHPVAKMHCQEVEELANIAIIGVDGLGRHPSLGAEMREPIMDFPRHLGRREGSFVGGSCRIAHDRTRIL